MDALVLTKIISLVLLGLLLEAYWRIYQPHLRKYLKAKQKKKPKKPRRLRPKSPRDCAACQNGVGVYFFYPRTDVAPYARAQEKDTDLRACLPKYELRILPSAG